MKDFICKKCGNTTYTMQEKLNGTGKAIGLYCAKCGTWHKWLNKQEKVIYTTVDSDKDKEIARLTKERDSKEEAYNKCYFDYKNWKDKANKYKHRAEVAERALQYAVSEYRCDECPCLDCNAEIRGSQECIDCICAEYKKKEAEKDIAEEGEE